MKKRQKSSLMLIVVTAFITTALALPALIRAGALEPTAPPGSTMKTLDQIPPIWGIKIGSCFERFDRWVMDAEGVLDKETGLGWEKSIGDYATVWVTLASAYCLN